MTRLINLLVGIGYFYVRVALNFWPFALGLLGVAFVYGLTLDSKDMASVLVRIANLSMAFPLFCVYFAGWFFWIYAKNHPGAISQLMQQPDLNSVFRFFNEIVAYCRRKKDRASS
jgi:hypothetical protein